MFSFLSPASSAVYRALYLEEPTLLDLCEKIAMLYSITPQQITHIYWQKADGIHVLVCDEVLQPSTHLLLGHNRGEAVIQSLVQHKQEF